MSVGTGSDFDFETGSDLVAESGPGFDFEIGPGFDADRGPYFEPGPFTLLPVAIWPLVIKFDF